MRISVVIPCHNAAATLDACLASVAGQTRAADEVILVDDASTDDACARARAGSRLPLRCVSGEGRGAGAARNRGVEAAAGDWLAFLDADDLWLPEHLERVLALAAEHDVVAVLNHTQRMDEQGRPLPPRPAPCEAPLVGEGDLAFLRLYRRAGVFPGMSACSLERAAFVACGGFDEAQPLRHDVELFLRLARGRRWVYDPRPTTRYRKDRAGSLSGDLCGRAFWRLVAFEKQQEALAGEPEYRALLEVLAGEALEKAHRFGSAAERRRAWERGARHLRGAHRLLWELLWRVPFFFPAARRLKWV